MKKTHLLLLAGLLFSACANKGVETLDDGITVSLTHPQANGVQKVRLKVMGDKLIRVSATAEDKFADPQSLIIVPQEGKTAFDVSQSDSLAVLTTAALKVEVNRNTGLVRFMDKEGKTILQEDNMGKTFTPIEVDGSKGYSVRDVFQTTADEALYGLGQHQADEFNYKGKNEELFQYNTKVSIPFIMSTRNYGLLWDNYSMGRFGDARPYQQLHKVFTLYDKDGKKGGLTGTYTPASEGETKTVVRTEDSLYYENAQSIVNLPEKFPLYGSHVSYEGSIEAPESGTYHFILYYAGYMNVQLGDSLVVPERWRTAWNPNSYKFTFHLSKGEKKALKIDWKPDGGVSYCGLRALSPLSDEEQQKLSFWFEMSKQMDYYFVAGNNMDEVIGGYRTLTGKSQVMPKWAMGFWQSRERYKTQEEILGALKTFRERQLPIDNIVLDWNYWPENAWGSHEFDKERFPNPKAMVDSIHALNARMMISVWPKFYYTTEHFKEFEKNGWMYMQAVKDSIRDWVGPGYIGSFYDAYSPEARKLFWNQMKEHLYPLGIDAWWMDASEPNVRDCVNMDYWKKLCGPTALGSSTEYLNAYSLMNAEAIYDGQRAESDKRVFLLTRSGFAGLQRYSTATWSGDIATRWEDLKAQISAGLNFAMSGVPYWTMDIGGFCVENRYVAAQLAYDNAKTENEDLKEWRELNDRWYQFGAFCPLYRAHGQFPLREIWNIAPENHPAYQSIKYYTKLRYNLMPYIYTQASKTYFNDYTIMRALVMDFTNDQNVWNVGDQFLFGPSLMVCPVYKYGARSREVYFPKGEGWYDFYTGKFIAGGQQQQVAAPYERIPLYVRAGSIVPFGPDMQYSDEKKAEQIDLYIYKGADATFSLYEDEGVNYNYEKGKYAVIPMSYNDKTGELVIDARKGEFDGMLKTRMFNVIVVDAAHPQGYTGGVQGQKVTYSGQKVNVKL